MARLSKHQYHLITSAIESIQDDREQEVLRLRYLHGMKWQEIADEVGWDRITIWRIHGDALQHFETLGGKKD